MKNIEKFILTTLIISIQTFSNAQSQEYIVSYNNDTIYGDVKRKTNLLGNPIVEYKIKLSNGERVDISPKEIKHIHTVDGLDGDSHFEAYLDWCFVKLVLDGRIKLYNIPDSAFYCVSKDNSPMQSTSINELFSNDKAHEEIANLLRDKPRIFEEFKDLKGNFKNIFYIINKYNTPIKRNKLD